jgi:transposase
MRLTDKQWEKIEHLVPDGPVRSDGKGRPWRGKREVLEGILWIVKQVPAGGSYRRTTLLIRPATVGFSSG